MYKSREAEIQKDNDTKKSNHTIHWEHGEEVAGVSVAIKEWEEERPLEVKGKRKNLKVGTNKEEI